MSRFKFKGWHQYLCRLYFPYALIRYCGDLLTTLLLISDLNNPVFGCCDDWTSVSSSGFAILTTRGGILTDASGVVKLRWSENQLAAGAVCQRGPKKNSIRFVVFISTVIHNGVVWTIIKFAYCSISDIRSQWSLGVFLSLFYLMLWKPMNRS